MLEYRIYQSSLLPLFAMPN